MSSTAAPESSRSALRGTPYKGLTPYGEEDAALFFGRDVWSDIVTDNIKAYRLTLLYGESGVGKSSVLRAGVVHRLRIQAAHNRASEGLPGMAIVVFSAWRGDVEAGLVRALDEAAQAEGVTNGHGSATEATLDAAVERCAARCGGKVFLVLDQFEEYFVYHPAGSEASGFDEALPRVLRRRELALNVLISIREDAVARLDRFKSGIPNLFDNYLRLDHLDRAAAREAIERPLEQFATSAHEAGPELIEQELVEAVLDEVQAGTLEVAQGGAKQVGGSAREVETPYLQLVMTRLWAEEARAGSDVIRLSTLKGLGGAQGIVGAHLGDAMAALPPGQRDVAALAFRYLVTRSRSKIAHSVTDLADWTDVSQPELAAVLERLSSGDTRILRPVGESSYEIYHDVLADAILAWRASHEAGRRVEEEKRLGEEAARRRLARLALVVGILAFAVVVLLGLLANSERNRAERQGKLAKRQGQIAFSRELAARSIEQGRLDADVGIWLAAAAWDAAHTSEASSALRTVLRRSPVRPPARLHTAGGSQAFVQAGYSPDGKRILTFGEGPTELWDAQSARHIAKLPLDGGSGPGATAFSADGSRVATAGRGRVTVWSAATGKRLRRVVMRRSAEGSIALNREGTLVAAPLRRGGIGVWRVRSGRRIGRPGGTQRFYVVQFAVGSDRLIGMGPGRRSSAEITVWRRSGGGRLARLGIGRRDIPLLSPDGRRVLLTSGRRAPRLVDLYTRRPVGKGIGRLPVRASGSFAPEGPYLMTVAGSTAKLWNADTGRQIGEHRFAGPLQTAVPTPDGTKAVVLLRNGEIRLWEKEPGRSTVITRARSRTRESISTVAIRPDGRQALTTGYPSPPGVWDLRDVGTVGLTLGGTDAPLSDVAVGARGRFIATGDANGAVRFWDRVSGRELGSVRAGRRAVTRVAFDRAGRRLVGADADGTVAVWDAATRRRLATVRTEGAPTDVALDPRGERIATGDKAGTAVVRPAHGGGRSTVIRASRRRLLSVQFSPDGRMLLTASRTSARIWDAGSGRLLVRLDARKRFHFACCFVPYPGAAFSPDGRRVVMIGTDGGLRLWDDRGTLLREIQADGHKIINHAAFSRDGSQVAAGGDDNSVHLIDARTGAARGRLRAPPDTEIARVDFSPDGTKVAGIASDGLTRVWDVRSGERLALLQGREPLNFYRSEFSPDGRQIITSDGDTGIAVFPCLVCLSPEDMVALATGAAHRRLNAHERRVYLHER